MAFVAAASAMVDGIDSHRPQQCPSCRGTALQRWGKARTEVQRWRCRTCERSFSTTTGTLLARLHAPGKLHLVLLDMLSEEPASCRGLAAKLAVSATTAWAWRQRVNRAFQRIAADRLVETAIAVNGSPLPAPHVTVEATVAVRESRKASREWVDHARDPASHPVPDRLRWLDYQEQRLPLPHPMTPFLLHVRLFRDKLGNCGAALVASRAARAVSYREIDIASSTVMQPAALQAAGGAPTAAVTELAFVPSLRERFTTFLRPFCGPARQHLAGYVAWFIARQTGAVEAVRSGLAAQAWRAMTVPAPTQFRTWAATVRDAGA